MMLTVAQRKTLIHAAPGRERLDLKLADVQVVNIHTGRMEAASLGITAGRIVILDAQALDAGTTVDAHVDAGGHILAETRMDIPLDPALQNIV